MPNIIEIDELSESELDVYARLTGAQLRNRLEPDKGIFIAESPTVIEVAMQGGCEPLSLLTEKRLINSSVAGIIEKMGDRPIYTADRELLKNITGFELTRGALCAMRRPKPKSLEEVCRGARRIAVLEDIADSTNIGAIFRSAAALGIDAVIVTSTCCDPLCRRAVRVSMGTVFLVPWAVCEGDVISALQSLGFKCGAMALSDSWTAIDDEKVKSEEKLAVVLGSEGFGLKQDTINACDYTLKIPMANSVDSLNVAAAAAVAFWELARENELRGL